MSADYQIMPVLKTHLPHHITHNQWVFIHAPSSQSMSTDCIYVGMMYVIVASFTDTLKVLDATNYVMTDILAIEPTVNVARPASKSVSTDALCGTCKHVQSY